MSINKNISFLVIATWAVCTFCCCKSHTERYLEKWLYKTVVFPTDLAFYHMGKDSVKYDYQHSSFKMLVLLDTVACINCQLRLDDWNRLMADFDTICSGKIRYVFMAQPYSRRLFIEELKNEDFTVPICLDDKKFRQLNEMPYNGTHSFLLNQANQIICVGNPLSNKEIRKLYKTILKSKKS